MAETNGASAFLTRRIGPLPLWAWAVAVGGAGLALRTLGRPSLITTTTRGSAAFASQPSPAAGGGGGAFPGVPPPVRPREPEPLHPPMSRAEPSELAAAVRAQTNALTTLLTALTAAFTRPSQPPAPAPPAAIAPPAPAAPIPAPTGASIPPPIPAPKLAVPALATGPSIPPAGSPFYELTNTLPAGAIVDRLSGIVTLPQSTTRSTVATVSPFNVVVAPPVATPTGPTVPSSAIGAVPATTAAPILPAITHPTTPGWYSGRYYTPEDLVSFGYITRAEYLDYQGGN